MNDEWIDGQLAACELCPRRCRADRRMEPAGFCRSGGDLGVHAVVLHQGEEPAISGEHGISNVFFSHCNLQCRFCQNYQISDNRRPPVPPRSLESVVESIGEHLRQGAQNVGFVSPSHRIPQMLEIMQGLDDRGMHPTYVYNSNAYDRVETLTRLDGKIGVYLPDLKYMDSALAEELSGSRDYPAAATAALKEMFRQKGERLECTRDGTAVSGMIIRHLVLPGHVDNSLACLRFVAENLSPRIHISLMAQYHPTARMRTHPVLNRRLSESEYDAVLDEMERLGLEHGWTQSLKSADVFLPDFEAEDPFA